MRTPLNLSAIVAAVTFLIGLGLQVSRFTNKLAAIGLFSTAGLFLAVLVLANIVRLTPLRWHPAVARLVAPPKSEPRLICSQAFIDWRNVVARKVSPHVFLCYFAQVGFKNDPLVAAAESRAVAVCSRVEFSLPTGERIEVKGRWSGSWDDHMHLDVPTNECIDLPGNDRPHLLTLAARNISLRNPSVMDDWHAFNPLNFRDWGFKKQYRLPGESMRVKVILRGENVPEQVWEFDLTKSDITCVSGPCDLAGSGGSAGD